MVFLVPESYLGPMLKISGGTCKKRKKGLPVYRIQDVLT